MWHVQQVQATPRWRLRQNPFSAILTCSVTRTCSLPLTPTGSLCPKSGCNSIVIVIVVARSLFSSFSSRVDVTKQVKKEVDNFVNKFSEFLRDDRALKKCAEKHYVFPVKTNLSVSTGSSQHDSGVGSKVIFFKAGNMQETMPHMLLLELPHQAKPSFPSQTCVWVSTLEVQLSSSLPL